MPAVETLLERFHAAHTQVLGVSVDSVYSHANWGRDLGGVSFPLLSDFEPKGAVARSYGVYLEKAGITDRATVIIDSAGIVRYAESVGPGGQRDIQALVAACEDIDRQHPVRQAASPSRPGLPADAVLYVKDGCGFSRAVLLGRDNLHLQGRLPVKNITHDQDAAEALQQIAGSKQVPCLVVGKRPLAESAEIIKYLVSVTTEPIG